MNREDISQSADDGHRRVSATSLNPTQVGQINVGVVRELLLGQLPLDPQPTHVRADNFSPVHGLTGLIARGMV